MLALNVLALIAFSYSEPPLFSGIEKLLLAGLLVVSLGAFWARFGQVLARIRASKSDPGFTLGSLGKRSWDFFWEVMCQAKVISERPLPGLAHAFVFWGFCAFALVSLNHFAAAFNLGFLSSRGFFGPVYFAFAALFALLVAVSILGLFIRRFLARPIWLGKKISYESGFIAFLIFVLMVTYLAAFCVPETGMMAKSLWWIHALAILIFLPLIPHTKHLHLVLSPLTVFLSRGEFSAIPKLVGDDDFGLVKGTDLTQLVSLQAYSCVECGRCTEHCPASNTGKELNPKEIILGIRGYLNDLGPQSEEPLLGKYNSQEAAFSAPPAERANFSARSASSTCPSSLGCGVAA